MMTLSYVTIRYWRTIKASSLSVWRSFRKGDSALGDDSDVHCRMMRAYKDVPDWWYLGVMLVSIGCGVAAIAAFPTHTPWWSLIVCMVIGWVFLIPTSLLTAITNKGISLDILFKIVSGSNISYALINQAAVEWSMVPWQSHGAIDPREWLHIGRTILTST